jgi:heme/copper-type cytochrome/quinol oxidase subunit 1
MLRTKPSGLTLLTVLGALMVIVGCGLWVIAPDRAADYGWFAYAPVSQESFTPPTILVPSAARYWGIGLAAFGAVLLAGVIGYRAGFRDARAESPEA